MQINCYFYCYNHPPPLKLIDTVYISYRIVSYRDHDQSTNKGNQPIQQIIRFVF